VEVEGRREDGSRLWLSAWQERAVCDGCECLITILVDVTEQRLAESQLQQGQEDLQHLLELSDRDREVIAYEIHDGVVQEMTGALMFLEVARRAVERGEPGALDQLQTVARLLKDGIQEARRLMDGVRLPDLDKEGLHGALQALAKKVTETAGIAIELEYGVAARDLPLATEKAIYRMVQECLNNVRRHSRSPRARVELTQHGEHLEIRVRDWGVGFNPARVAKDALGLKGLRQRAQLLGGSVEIRQPPDKGTEIRIEFPLGPRTCLS
jgi:signal transduction histidine kinase